MEQLARKALSYFNQTSNKKEIFIAYWQLGQALFKQGSYDESLTNLKQSHDWADKQKDSGWMLNNLESMTEIYRERGDYDKLLETQGEIIRIERASGDNEDYTIHELWLMGLMYMLLEEYPIALSYWRPVFGGGQNEYFGAWNMTEYASLLTLANQPDSALYYYNRFDSAKADISELRLFLTGQRRIFSCIEELQKCITLFSAWSYLPPAVK
jgi:tetratricopeptide (TPR) repeat protein